MEYATLNNGIKMPMAGIGTFLLTPDEAEASVQHPPVTEKDSTKWWRMRWLGKST